MTLGIYVLSCAISTFIGLVAGAMITKDDLKRIRGIERKTIYNEAEQYYKQAYEDKIKELERKVSGR